MTHVPYRGGGPAMSDLIGGQVLATFTAPAVAIEHIRSGKVRALAVTTEQHARMFFPISRPSRRSCRASQSGGFFGIGAPKGAPAEIVDRLNREINAALADPKMKARSGQAGASTFGARPLTSAS